MRQDKSTIKSHRDLIVWQKGMDLAVAAYRFTSAFPSEERHGLTSQIRRSGASIPANIAEGYERESAGAYAQHLRIAQGSLKEFETHLELASRIGIATRDVVVPLIAAADEIGRMLRSLIRSIER